MDAIIDAHLNRLDEEHESEHKSDAFPHTDEYMAAWFEWIIVDYRWR